MSIDSSIKSLKNKLCWAVIAGTNTGSVVKLGFGEKIKRKKALTNPSLTVEEKDFTAEMELMVWCAWRLTDSNKVLCGWRDSNEATGNMITGLSLLRDKTVIDANIEGKACDLTILFEGEILLQLFCDQTNDFDADENYSLFVNNYIYTIGLNSELEVAERK